MTNHTMEPWEYKPATSVLHHRIVGARAIVTIAKSYMKEADAKRIVACVNACVGISNDQLDSWQLISNGILPVIKHQTDYANTIERQRDDLLEAVGRLPVTEWADHIKSLAKVIEAEK